MVYVLLHIYHRHPIDATEPFQLLKYRWAPCVAPSEQVLVATPQSINLRPAFVGGPGLPRRRSLGSNFQQGSWEPTR